MPLFHCGLYAEVAGVEGATCCRHGDHGKIGGKGKRNVASSGSHDLRRRWEII